MSKAQTVANGSKLFFKKIPRYQKALIVLLMVLATLILFVAVTESSTTSEAWLPDAGKHKTADGVLFNLPVKAEIITTEYGRAERYTTTTARGARPPWTTIYEFRANKLLNPSACPNITNFEALLPSGCDKLGEFKGNPVYSINRSLPSGTTEYFTVVNGVFIYIKSGGDGGRSLDYLKTFEVMPHYKVNAYLSVNSEQVEQVLVKQRLEKASDQ